MKSLTLLLSILMLVLSCSDRDDDLQAPTIRIRNISSIPFDEVQVGEQETLHENIAPGEYSVYLPYETAYRFAYISIQAGEETYVLQPIDFTGETELPVGLYTYELDLGAEGEVILNFIAD